MTLPNLSILKINGLCNDFTERTPKVRLKRKEEKWSGCCDFCFSLGFPLQKLVLSSFYVFKFCFLHSSFALSSFLLTSISFPSPLPLSGLEFKFRFRTCHSFHTCWLLSSISSGLTLGFSFHYLYPPLAFCWRFESCLLQDISKHSEGLLLLALFKKTY